MDKKLSIQENIMLSPPHFTGDEMDYLKEGLTQFPVGGNSEIVNSFEEKIAKRMGINGTLALNSGTSAIHLALILLGIQAGDEVICSSFTFIATCNPILYLKAKPVFVDSEADTWNMDPHLLEEAVVDRIRKGKKPKAILLVHLYGMPAKLNQILAVASRYGIPLIEDAAEAIGSKYRDKPVGTFGVIGIYSFNGNKIITTMGGGALVTDRQDYLLKARFLSTQAKENASYYLHSESGYNYSMNNISAAVGLAQIKVLDSRISSRRRLYHLYKKALGGYGISFQEEPIGVFCNRWLTTILIDKELVGTNKEELVRALNSKGIESRHVWKPMHQQPVFEGTPFYSNGVSDSLFDQGLCLPSGSNITDQQFERIRSALIPLFS